MKTILKPTLASTEASLPTGAQTKQGLYKNYSGMLLGYLYEALKDMQVAEQYLVDIFNGLQFADIQAITKPGINTFVQLQLRARKKLAEFLATMNDCADTDKKPQPMVVNGNRFIDNMSHEQQVVFCGVHYHGKTVATLSEQLHKTEAEIKRILKDSFSIIRNQRNDTATVHR